MNTRPQARDDVQVSVHGEEAWLEDRARGKVHVLNETAIFIWQLCDGRHTVEDIEMKVRAAFNVPPEVDVRQDVQRTLQGLRRRDLFVLPRH